MRMQNKTVAAGKVPRHGVARVISKQGLASRTQAAAWVRDGRVSVNGVRVRDPEHPVRMGLDRIEIAGQEATTAPRRVLMLNKPRGLVTTARDEQGRDTVYRCFDGAALPWLAPVGRLDKASEGLLLFSNDPAWAARVTDPASGALMYIRAGLPAGTRVAGKWSWDRETRADAEIVFTPNGDFVLAMLFRQANWGDWQAASPIMAHLTRAP